VQEQQRLRELLVRPDSAAAAALNARLENPLGREHRAMELLRRPELDYASLTAIAELGPGVTDPQVAEQVEVQAKYAGYIERQQLEIERQRRHEQQPLPLDLDYRKVTGLSAEVQEKFRQVRPETVGQAARIPGVTPAAISLLLVHLKKQGLKAERAAQAAAGLGA
jgi:tRNA uridine 5-carboxymethylaminomethyl modification enzyme